MRVCVLKGGRSLERQVSLASGGRVQDALERLGHEVHGVDVDHDLVRTVRRLAPDRAFVALHGRDGEDGTVQELLDLLGVPHTGSGVSACIRCADKVLAKHAFLDAGLPTPAFVAFNETAFKELGAADALDSIGERLGFPLVVKPADQGSALGIKVARGAAEIPGALVAAFSYSAKVLLEAHVAGRDLAISVLGDEALPIVEAVPRDGDAGDPYSDRYTIGAARFACPADLDAETTARAQALAVAAHRTLGCAGFSRVDVLLDAAGGLHLLEVNAIPGLTGTSLLPQAAEAAGIGFDALIARMLGG